LGIGADICRTNKGINFSEGFGKIVYFKLFCGTVFENVLLIMYSEEKFCSSKFTFPIVIKKYQVGSLTFISKIY